MKKIKLLVIDKSKEFSMLVKDYISVIEEVDFCGAAYDGITALSMIREIKPDVIILDNLIPHLDGIGVLRQLKKHDPDIMPKVVAITEAPSPAYVTELNRLGADYIISRNMDIDEIVDRCIMVTNLSYESSTFIHTDLESMATSHIIRLGMPENISGYPFLRTSVILSAESPELVHSVTTKLYPEVAKIHNTTPSKVERNIRSAIEIAWNKGDMQHFEKLFGTAFVQNNNRPSNTRLIAKLADTLRLEMKKVRKIIK